MTLDQVVAACTTVPARLLGMKGQLGTLALGALADVAVFRRGKKRLEVKNFWAIPSSAIICSFPK